MVLKGDGEKISHLEKNKGRVPVSRKMTPTHRGVLTFTLRAFSRRFCPKRLTVIHTFINWWWWLPCKVPTSTSGAMWASVSCPRTLRHADQGNQTNDLLITRRWLFPWITATGQKNTNTTQIDSHHALFRLLKQGKQSVFRQVHM